MAEEGRPWWKASPVNGAPSLGVKQSPNSKTVKQSPNSKTVIRKPWDHSAVSVKKEPVNNSPPSALCKPPAFSPVLSSGAKSPAVFTPIKSVKTELPDIKDEPMAYIERALVKGEFPRDFNWPIGKWEPIPLQNHVKNETETNHYIPKPLSEMELKQRFTAPPRPRRGPPPDWHYIYSRETHEPGPWARSWWNENVERALNRRREAYFQTKLNDNAPVEVRMERIWAFEVAKDEARRVIAESKWKASARDSGYVLDSDAINFGASTSRDTGCTAADRTLSIQDRLGRIPDTGCTAADRTLSIQDRLGRIPVVGDEDGKELPPTEEMEKAQPDEIQVVPHDKENVEVLTIEEEIEDAMSNYEDDSGDIRIDGELGSSDVIFIQRKQGEVTFLAQVDGRIIKMNRKRKLCVTFSNSLDAKRNRVITLGAESEEVTNSTEKEETNTTEEEEINTTEKEETHTTEKEETHTIDKEETHTTEKEETDSVILNNVSETVDVTKKQDDEITSVGDTCDNTSDSQECSAVEATVTNLFQDENKQESPLSVESENVNPFNSSAVNTCVAENKGYSGAQLGQGQITADILSENESQNFVKDDIEEVDLSDDEPQFIGSASQKVTSKEEEADILEKSEVDVSVVTDKVEVSDMQDAHMKEDIVFLETVISVGAKLQSVPAIGDLSRATVKQENNSAESTITDVTEGAYSYENEKEEPMQENKLEDGLVEIQCIPNSENTKSKGSKSTVNTFGNPEADVCEIGSFATGKENKDLELSMKVFDLDDDVLEIDVSEEELVEKTINSSDCDMGDSSVGECEMDENMLVDKKDDKHDSSLKDQLGEESNSCDVEVVEVDEEIEIVREDLAPKENNANKTGRMQQRISKVKEQDVNRSSPRHKTVANSDTRVTRRSAIMGEKRQLSSKETDGHSSFSTGVRTRSRRH